MKKYLINGLIILLTFVITFVATVFFDLIKEGMYNSFGLSKGIGLLGVFLSLFAISAIGLTQFKNRIGSWGILIPMVLAPLIMVIMLSMSTSVKFTIKISPFYLSSILGILAGYLYQSREQKKFMHPLLLLIFPLIMSFGVYDLWVHRIEYGNWTGDVTAQRAAPFELLNKAEEVVTNESLEGKIVLFDFWFISCGPCWSKFPDLQLVYEKYESNPLVEIYAVNRPMKSDKTDALFTRIEDKGYSFPVLAGTQEIMDTLDVYKYPTVMLINQKGELVFMGELEDAEKKLASMLDQ